MKQLPNGYKARLIKGKIVIVKVATKEQVKVVVTKVARPVAVPVSAPVSVFAVVAKIYAAPKVAPIDYGAKGSLGNNRGFSLLR